MSILHARQRFSLLFLVASLCLCTLAARAQDPGTLDTSFDPGSGPSGNIFDMTVKGGGQIVIVGSFGAFNGVVRHNLAQLNANGSVDMGFDPGNGPQSSAGSVILAGGQPIIAGFNQYIHSGVSRDGIARLNGDASLDTGFEANPSGGVGRIAAQGSQIIAVGSFESDGVTRAGVVRLNSDGSLDTSFQGPGFYSISDIAVNGSQAVIVGNFYIGDVPRRIARLTGNGGNDSGFDPGTGPNDGGAINAVAVQPDGKVIIGGTFTSFNGVARNRIARLNANGSVDGSFDPGAGADESVADVALQADGKILLCGNFTAVGGKVRAYLARLNVDGSLDSGFDPGGGPDKPVSHLVVQADGQILIAGGFTSYNGVARKFIARIHGGASGTATGDLVFEKGNGGFFGDGTYQKVPLGEQLRHDELTPGEVLKYTIKVQNDGTGSPATFHLRTQAPMANTGWRFRLLFGDADISPSASDTNGWTTPAIPPQHEVVLTLEAEPEVADADESAQLQFFLAPDNAPTTVSDALEINLERTDVIFVNQAADTDDATPEDGSPDVNPILDGVQITLRSAINFSNRKPARDTIKFSVPGAPIPLIKPTRALPPVTAPFVLAGDSTAGKKVELDGSAAGESDGLVIETEKSIVRGFVIHSFDGSGIEIGGPGSNRVQGCSIGTNVAGVAARTNRHHGIHVISPKNTIGGAAAKLGFAPGNLISGNGYGNFNGINAGVWIEGDSANENVVIGNLIGTDLTGKVALKNEEVGVFVGGARNRIGGTTAGERNIVSGNTSAGIVLSGPSAKDNLVLGNFVGTNLSGTAAVGNGNLGIQLEGGASENTLGGTVAGSRNVSPATAGVRAMMSTRESASASRASRRKTKCKGTMSASTRLERKRSRTPMGSSSRAPGRTSSAALLLPRGMSFLETSGPAFSLARRQNLRALVRRTLWPGTSSAPIKAGLALCPMRWA